jgi:hypothetical protein
MTKLVVKLNILWNIITNKYKHFVVLDISEEQMINLFSDEDFEVEVMYHGLQPYVVQRMINQCSTVKDDIDMMLDKAQFEAEAELHNRKNKPDDIQTSED